MTTDLRGRAYRANLNKPEWNFAFFYKTFPSSRNAILFFTDFTFYSVFSINLVCFSLTQSQSGFLWAPLVVEV